jgi:hypothetical protein
MQPLANRPRVFVSSTINDFRDLRPSLKYWLEELGLEVRMSEFNDFQRAPDEGTFESCFHAIADCHYYVLLVGGRRGSLYRDGVSVTQQEYRVAADLARQGRLSPLIFVRDDVMTALGEREALQCDVSAGIDDTESRALENPIFIKTFIDEIKSTESGRRGTDPTGTMWIYRFDDFRDIVEALRVGLRLQASVPRQALLANVRWEVEENIAALCSKRGDLLVCGHVWLNSLRHDLDLQSSDFAHPIPLTPNQAQRVDLFLVLGMPHESRLRVSALKDGIASGQFLAYQGDTGRLVPGPELEAMYKLLMEIERYQSMLAALRPELPQLFVELGSAKAERRTAYIVGHHLGFLFALHDAEENVLRLSATLLAYIADPRAGVHMPTLNPTTPFREQVEELQAEQATHEDVTRWLGNRYLRDRITGEADASIEEILDAQEQFPQLRAEMKRVEDELAVWASEVTDECRRRADDNGQAAALEWFREQLVQQKARNR